MAPKRKQKRTPRRFNVRFRKMGEEDFAVGYTKNVSVGGLFIGTIRPLPPGTEILVEIKEADQLRRRPAAVVHAARVSPLLASVRTSGMGVRFLDLLEAAESGPETGKSDRETTVESGKQEETEALDTAVPSDLEVDLSNVERFRDAFRRDIQYGLIFVQSPSPLELGQQVQVSILMPAGGDNVSLDARVDRETICRSEAYGELGAPGFMLVFVESDRAVRQLRAFL